MFLDGLGHRRSARFAMTSAARPPRRPWTGRPEHSRRSSDPRTWQRSSRPVSQRVAQSGSRDRIQLFPRPGGTIVAWSGDHPMYWEVDVRATLTADCLVKRTRPDCSAWRPGFPPSIAGCPTPRAKAGDPGLGPQRYLRQCSGERGPPGECQPPSSALWPEYAEYQPRPERPRNHSPGLGVAVTDPQPHAHAISSTAWLHQSQVAMRLSIWTIWPDGAA